MSIFGWSLPPGVTHKMIDDQFGGEGPLDCPLCADGVDLDGPDCAKDATHGPTCPKHGCVHCLDLEKQRVYCASPFCGDYIRAGKTPVEHDGKKFCDQICLNNYLDPVEY